jgi:hypothetical protein
MKSLKSIIRREKEYHTLTEIEKAIIAAYWAGRESMRGEIVARLEKNRDAYQGGRYKHQERKAIQEVLRDPLLGGHGNHMGDEILAWRFDIHE